MAHSKDKISEYFGKPDLVYRSLAMGECNERFYYGHFIEQDGKLTSCVITSGRELFVGKDEIKNFGVNFNFDFPEHILDGKWSNASIKSWLNNENEKIDLKSVFDQILAIQKKFIYHSDPRYHSFIAIWVIGTYFYQLFESFGRILFQAPKNSGKTKQTMILKLMCFNPIFSCNISGSALFRSIEATGATILVDDFDLIHDKQRDDILQLIRAGYKKGQKYVRVGEKAQKQFIPEAFRVYCPLAVNNTLGLDQVSRDRCIHLNLLKAPDNKLMAQKIKEASPAWQLLRDRLYICGVTNWKSVKMAYDRLEIEELGSRDLELFAPFLAIASLISPQAYQNVLELAIDLSEKKRVREIEGDWEYIMLKFIHFQLDQKDQAEFNIAQIFNGVKEEADFQSEFGFKRKIGEFLRNVPRISVRKLHGVDYFLVKREVLDELIKARDFEFPKENWIVKSELK